MAEISEGDVVDQEGDFEDQGCHNEQFYQPLIIAEPEPPYNRLTPPVDIISHQSPLPSYTVTYIDQDYPITTSGTDDVISSGCYGNVTPPVTPQPSEDEGVTVKPSHSYVALIAMALLESPTRELVLGDIYEYIMSNFPYYRSRNDRWKNSIRHTLSLNQCFVKRWKPFCGKGHFWSLHEDYVVQFQQGDFRRPKTAQKRYNKKQKPSEPAPAPKRKQTEIDPCHSDEGDDLGPISKYARTTEPQHVTTINSLSPSSSPCDVITHDPRLHGYRDAAPCIGLHEPFGYNNGLPTYQQFINTPLYNHPALRAMPPPLYLPSPPNFTHNHPQHFHSPYHQGNVPGNVPNNAMSRFPQWPGTDSFPYPLSPTFALISPSYLQSMPDLSHQHLSPLLGGVPLGTVFNFPDMTLRPDM